MFRKIELGKVDFNRTGRKSNLVEIKIALKTNRNGVEVFTASGSIYNHIQSDWISGGQNLDTINEFASMRNNKIFATVYRLWKLYHLNDLNAGTKEQMEFLARPEVQKSIERGRRRKNSFCKYDFQKEHDSYYATVRKLKRCKLYKVKHNGKDYKYGHGWIAFPIPVEDLKIIKSLFYRDVK